MKKKKKTLPKDSSLNLFLAFKQCLLANLLLFF